MLTSPAPITNFVLFLQFISPPAHIHTQIKLSSTPSNQLQQIVERANQIQENLICPQTFKVKTLLCQNNTLIESLSSIRVEGTKGKLCRLEGIQKIANYCQLQKLNFKNICKDLLIKETNLEKKIIKYRESQEIVQLLHSAIQFLKFQTYCGEISIFSQNLKNLEVPQFVKNLKANKEEVETMELQWDLADSCVKGSVPLPYQRSISRFHCYQIFSRIDCLGYKKIAVALIGCSVLTALANLVKIEIKKLKITRGKVLLSYIHAFEQNNLYEKKVKTRVLSNYMHGFSKKKKYQTKTALLRIKHCMLGLINTQRYFAIKRQREIQKIQVNLRSFLSHKKYLKNEQEVYQAAQQKQAQKNRKDYLDVVIQTNKLLAAKNGYVGYGIQCMIWIISMNSWSNCAEFSPARILEIFKKSLSAKSSIIKIQMEATQLNIFGGDEQKYSLGPTYQRQKQQLRGATFVSADQLSGFWLDSQSKIYAKGNNHYGQLGIGKDKPYVSEWQKIPIKQKIKHFACGGKRSICVTISQQLYRWGHFDNENHFNPVLVKAPLFLRGKQIKGVSCGFAGFFIICSDGTIFDLEKGVLKTMKKDYNQRAILTTGNSLFEMTYAVGVTVHCYDEVKKKSVLAWFKKNYHPVARKESQQFLIGDENCSSNSNQMHVFSEPLF